MSRDSFQSKNTHTVTQIVCLASKLFSFFKKGGCGVFYFVNDSQIFSLSLSLCFMFKTWESKNVNTSLIWVTAMVLVRVVWMDGWMSSGYRWRLYDVCGGGGGYTCLYPCPSCTRTFIGLYLQLTVVLLLLLLLLVVLYVWWCRRCCICVVCRVCRVIPICCTPPLCTCSSNPC